MVFSVPSQDGWASVRHAKKSLWSNETFPEVGIQSIHVGRKLQELKLKSQKHIHMMHQLKAGNWTSTAQTQNFSYWESTFTPHLISPSVAPLHLPCGVSKNTTVNDHIAHFIQPEGWLCRQCCHSTQAATALQGFSAFPAGSVQRGRLSNTLLPKT